MGQLTGSGLLGKAKEANKKSEIASIKEEIQMEIFAEQAEKNGDISDVALKHILEKHGVLSLDEKKLIDKTLTTTKGNHEIKVSEIFNGTTVKDVPKNPTFTTVTNQPEINQFNKSNTYYVSWDLTSSPYNINDTTLISETAPDNWYNYTSGINHWANIKTTGGGNDCYWVWIPRYAYKVPTKPTTNEPVAENIEVKFLEGKTNKPIGETTEITNTTPTPGTWVVHPAFTNEGNGGLGNLTGIWVAKLEASSNSSTVVENPEVAQLSIDGGSETDTDLKVRVKPNVTSWRGISVNNIFTVCKNLTTSGNSLEGTLGIDSHMMKNTEWGAVAYLSMSVYGKNSEVWNNPYYNNKTNCSPITGLCGKATNAKDLSRTNLNDTCKYNEEGGGNASTTGNVYGVYDISGGAWECVAGIYKGTTSDNLGNNTNRSNLWDVNNLKYVDQYTETTGSQSTYFENTNKYGDAVYETSSCGNSYSGSWDYSKSCYPSSILPVFGRGGHAFDGSAAGVFAFGDDSGGAYAFLSFRPVVLSSQS